MENNGHSRLSLNECKLLSPCWCCCSRCRFRLHQCAHHLGHRQQTPWAPLCLLRPLHRARAILSRSLCCWDQEACPSLPHLAHIQQPQICACRRSRWRLTAARPRGVLRPTVAGPRRMLGCPHLGFGASTPRGLGLYQVRVQLIAAAHALM
jgi:hypothetical protein